MCAIIHSERRRITQVAEENEKLPATPDEKEEENRLEREQEEEEAEIAEYQAKLSPKAQKTWQIILGWAFGFGIWFCLALGAYFPDNVIMTWLFLILFVVAMIIRRQVEARTGVSMRTFMLHLLISMVVFLVVYIILGPVTHVLDPENFIS